MTIIAMVCSSFVAINKGTNQRYPYAPLGAEWAPSVRVGNLLASRYLDMNQYDYNFPQIMHVDKFVPETVEWGSSTI